MDDVFLDFHVCLALSYCHKFHLQAFHGFLDEIYNFVGYFVHIPTFPHPQLWDNIIGILVIYPWQGYIISPWFYHLEDTLIYI